MIGARLQTVSMEHLDSGPFRFPTHSLPRLFLSRERSQAHGMAIVETNLRGSNAIRILRTKRIGRRGLPGFRQGGRGLQEDRATERRDAVVIHAVRQRERG